MSREPHAAGAGRDAEVHAVRRTEGTKPVDDGIESMPLERENPRESAGGVRGGHSHAPNEQVDRELDRGVAREHLRSPSQGARPEDHRE